MQTSPRVHVTKPSRMKTEFLVSLRVDRPAQGVEAKMECRIRPALEDDADEISGVILRSLRETNAKDYTSEIIERVEGSFSPVAGPGANQQAHRREL